MIEFSFFVDCKVELNKKKKKIRLLSSVLWPSFDEVKALVYSNESLASTLFYDCRGERIAMTQRLQHELQLANYGECLHNTNEKSNVIFRHPARKKVSDL